MKNILHALVLAATLAAILDAVACGGSSSSSGSSGSGSGGAQPVANTVTITAGPGPSATNPYMNGVFVDVTVCVPGSSTQCTTIPDVLLDTGSSGLRVLSSALGGLPLTNMTASDGSTVGNCIQYVDLSYNWGAVARADIRMAGEVASGVPIQIIADPSSTFPGAPSACTNGGTAANTVDALGAKGVLGVSSYLYDCGLACAPGTTSNGGMYFTCPDTSCQLATVSLPNQLQNPVALFASDNNGLSITLPTLPDAGLPSTTGTLTFGISTQTNNLLNSAVVQTPNNRGNFTTVFKNASYTSSFIDSGSSAIYFLDSPTTGLPACSLSTGFYCPATIQHLSASNTGANGRSKTVSFSVTNADNLPAPNWVFNDVAGSSLSGNSQSGLPSLYFDWGLPFFFGRTVFVAIEGKSTTGGTGPYWAY